MTHTHPHETLVKTFDHNGLAVDVVRWAESIWCGKVGYAANNTDEPDVDAIARDAASLFQTHAPNQREMNWEVCMSLNYLSAKRPNGVMFGFQVETGTQPEGYDIVRVPSALYMKLPMTEKAFAALGVAPWTGGIPPYEWVGEMLAPRFGYEYGDDTLPIFEYYLHNPENFAVEACYLYVPVQERSNQYVE